MGLLPITDRDRLLFPIYSASWCTLSTLLAGKLVQPQLLTSGSSDPNTVISAVRAYGISSFERRWFVPGVICCLLLVGPVFAIVSVVSRHVTDENAE